MAQIGMIFVAIGLIWEGAKGFRDRGLKIGLAKATKPLDRSQGRVVGGILIAAGIASLIFGFVVLPRLMPN